MSNNRNELLRRLAVASQSGSLQEQRDLVKALAQLDKQATRDAEEERSLDWADTAIKARFEPRIAHTMHSEQTDWMEELSTTASSNDYHNSIHAEASMWFNRVDNDVKADPEEFAEQARGVARRVTGSYGDKAESAARDFLSYVAFLYKQSASGLPQVQQEFDSHDQYAPTPVPPEVFPTFEGPVHPINEWVENGSETDSERPHRAQDVGGVESHPLPDEGESDDVQGYPDSSESGTGENSSHDEDDAEDRSDNENWPETEPSGDAAAEGARPSEHSEEDDLTSKESRLEAISLWDVIENEFNNNNSNEGGGGMAGMKGEKHKLKDVDISNPSAPGPTLSGELDPPYKNDPPQVPSAAIEGEMRDTRKKQNKPNAQRPHPAHGKLGRDMPPSKVNPGGSPGPEMVIGPDGRETEYQQPAPIGSSDYNQHAQTRRQKAMEMKPDRVKQVEDNRARGIDTPAPSKAASWVAARLYEKLGMHPADSPGGVSSHPATGPGTGPDGGTGAPGSEPPGDPAQGPMGGEPPAPVDKPDHDTLMQRRKDIAGVDSFPAPNDPTNNSSTL